MTDTYLNPVYRHSCPDPFVLKHRGEYWAYCTGLRPDGGCFAVLHSTDLVHWREVGSAMQPLPGGHPDYWAPEVTYDNGRFYLYYSVGNETLMELRVAVARHPAGAFVDSGHRLTAEQFAIDPHVFCDDDGQRYLFYATDFLEHARIGTGTVVDRLLDPFTLAGQPRPVTRACHDWQIYDPQRVEKGGVCWHTVEGPFVLKHEGRYYQMFSGGNHKNLTYGVGYGLADRLDMPGEWDQPEDGPIMRSAPEIGVIGPGHNSVVRGLDPRELFVVYHRWQPETDERVMAIDRLGWRDGRLAIYGPSTTPQPVPRRPTVAGVTAFAGPSGAWSVAGTQATLHGAATARSRAALALTLAPPAAWALEVSLRAAAHVAAVPDPSLGAAGEPGLDSGSAGELGLDLVGPAQPVLSLGPAGEPGLPGSGQAGYPWLRLTIDLFSRQVIVHSPTGRHAVAPPRAFDPLAWHVLRLECDGAHLSLAFDDVVARWSGAAQPLAEIGLFARSLTAHFDALALTVD